MVIQIFESWLRMLQDVVKREEKPSQEVRERVRAKK